MDHLEYLGGYPTLTSGKSYMITATEEGFHFHPKSTWGDNKIITIPLLNVHGIEIDGQVYRSAGKAAAGAIVGGLLTGGIGLIAGAAFGARRRSSASLTINVFENDRPFRIQFTPHKSAAEVGDYLLNWLYKDRTPKNDEEFERRFNASTSAMERAKMLTDAYSKSEISKEKFTKLKEKIY